MEENESALQGILEDMMKQLMTKELLYEPLKELNDKVGFATQKMDTVIESIHSSPGTSEKMPQPFRWKTSHALRGKRPAQQRLSQYLKIPITRMEIQRRVRSSQLL